MIAFCLFDKPTPHFVHSFPFTLPTLPHYTDHSVISELSHIFNLIFSCLLFLRLFGLQESQEVKIRGSHLRRTDITKNVLTSIFLFFFLESRNCGRCRKCGTDPFNFCPYVEKKVYYFLCFRGGGDYNCSRSLFQYI